MKLLLISSLSNVMPSEYYAPVENQVYLIAKELAKKHEIWISCLKGSKVPEGCNIVEVQNKDDEAKAYESYKPMLNQFHSILDFSNLKYAYVYKHEENQDLKLFGCCYPYQAAGYNTAPPIPFPRMVATSNAMSKAMTLRLGCMFKHVHYAPMPIHKDFESDPVPDEQRRLLFCGRLEKSKGPAIAIGLARQTRIGLDIIGEDIKISDQRDTILLGEKADGRLIKMFGRVNEGLKAQFLSRAKALVMPYLDDISAYTCQTILEAFQYGTPVITFNHGAVTEFVEDGVNGLIVDDIDDLPDAVVNVDAISTDKCQETAQKYSIEAAVCKYEKLLQEEW